MIARPPETLRADPFFPSFIAGLESVLSEHGHALLLQVGPSTSGARRPTAGWRTRAGSTASSSPTCSSTTRAPLCWPSSGCPAVIVGPALDERVLARRSVSTTPPGSRAAVEHLVALGPPRIAHVAGPREMVHGASRRDAWSETLRAAGLPEGPASRPTSPPSPGAAATRDLLDLAEPPTAIVYANDLMAMAGLSLAVSRGIDVPGQLSITGYDDTEIAAHLQPSLTTVAHRRRRPGAGPPRRGCSS